MPLSRYISTGSNTTVKSGEGRVYGFVAGSTTANGGTVFLVDSVSIGVTPNYITQLSNSSNLLTFPLTAAGASVTSLGIRYQDGLTVAATSNAPVTVIYD